MLLRKTDKLDKLDGIEAKISHFQTSLTNMTDKIADFSKKLQILETMTVLVPQVNAAVVDIDKLKSDYNSLREIVDSKLSFILTSICYSNVKNIFKISFFNCKSILFCIYVVATLSLF